MDLQDSGAGASWWFRPTACRHSGQSPEAGSTTPWSRRSPAPFAGARLLETGVHGTVDEIARAEDINPSYVSRILRLTLLAPDIVDAILDGRQPSALTLARLMKPIPLEWERQRKWIQNW